MNLRTKLALLQKHLARPALSQDDGAFSGDMTCPACGATIQAGMKSPEPSSHEHMPDTTYNVAGMSVVGQGMTIIQSDEARGVITAIIQSPDVPHVVKLGDELVQIVYEAACVREMAEGYLAAGKQRAIGVYHQEVTEDGIEDPDGKYAVMVESFLAPVCYEVGGTHVIQGSWVGSFLATNPEVKRALLQGVLNAPSLTAELSACELEDIKESA